MEIIDQVVGQHGGIAHRKTLGNRDLRYVWNHPRELGSLVIAVAVHNSAHEYPVIAVLRDVVIQFRNVGIEGQRSRPRKSEALVVEAIPAYGEGFVGGGITLQDPLCGWVCARPLGADAFTGAIGIEQRQSSRRHGYEEITGRYPGGVGDGNAGTVVAG